MAGPLKGLVVVAVEQAVAAPFCTSRLADAGATVIKIERPEGDFARFYDRAAKGESSYFVWLNRGKSSVVLDLSQEAARGQLRRLIGRADIFVQNLRPGAFERLGLGIETLCAADRRLICCSISGYGDHGPMAERKAYDLLIQAESGLASVTGGPESPARCGISLVDIATGATAHAAILEALIGRSMTGEGADIRISMFDVMADWLSVPLLNCENGQPPQRVGLAHPSIAPYGVFASMDGRPILVAVQSEREWRVFASEVLACQKLSDASDYATNVLRVENRRALDARIAEIFGSLSHAELVRRLMLTQTAFADLNDLNDLSIHPHLRRIMVDTPGGQVAYPAPGPLFDNETRAADRVPALGADTDEILQGLSQ